MKLHGITCGLVALTLAVPIVGCHRGDDDEHRERDDRRVERHDPEDYRAPRTSPRGDQYKRPPRDVSDRY